MTKNPTALNIKPLADRIIVNDPKADANTDAANQMLGGIIIPAIARDGMAEQLRGGDTKHFVVTALAVGEGCKLVKQGQKLVISDIGLFRVKVGELTFCGVGEANVVAVLE